MESRRQKSTWGGRYSNKGQVDFTLKGTVEQIRENPEQEVDYVEFFIENPLKKTNICLFTVTVGWDLPQLNEGDEVRFDLIETDKGLQARNVEVINVKVFNK